MDLQIAERIEMRCSRMLERSTKGLPELLTHENWKGIPGVAHGMCRDLLVLGMLKARQNESLDEVFKIFCKGQDAVEYLLKVPSGHLPISRLDIALYLCLITGEFTKARDLASRIQNEELVFIKSSHCDLHAKMLAAFILSDIDGIIEYENKLFSLTRIHWWERQRLYFEMYKNITLNDAHSLNENLLSAQEYFASREKDKKFGDQLCEYGGLTYNQFCLDFMGLGILSFAIHKGIKIEYSSDYIPFKLLELANGRA